VEREHDLHSHPVGDMVLFMIEGSARMKVGDREWDIGPDEAVFVPEGMEHSIKNMGNSPLKYLTIYSPVDPLKDLVPKNERVSGS